MIPILKKTSNIIIGIIFLFLLFLLLWTNKTFIKHKTIKALGGYTKKEVVRKIDTLKSRIDTINFNHAKTITKLTIKKPDTITKYKYIIKTQSSTNGKTVEIKKIADSVLVYNNKINDSLIEGNIKTVINSKTSNIIEQDLEYKPKFPKIIKEYITIKETVTETLSNEPTSEFGVGITGNNLFFLGPKIQYKTKKGIEIEASYLWNVNNNNTLILNNNNIKNIISIGIVKTF